MPGRFFDALPGFGDWRQYKQKNRLKYVALGRGGPDEGQKSLFFWPIRNNMSVTGFLPKPSLRQFPGASFVHLQGARMVHLEFPPHR